MTDTELTPNEEAALKVIQPMLDCDFCLTCPDDAKDVIEGVAALLKQARREVWEAAIAAIPTNWLDSLLSGPDAVVHKPVNCPQIEAVLNGVKARLEVARAAEAKGE